MGKKCCMHNISLILLYDRTQQHKNWKTLFANLSVEIYSPKYYDFSLLCNISCQIFHFVLVLKEKLKDQTSK